MTETRETSKCKCNPYREGGPGLLGVHSKGCPAIQPDPAPRVVAEPRCPTCSSGRKDRRHEDPDGCACRDPWHSEPRVIAEVCYTCDKAYGAVVEAAPWCRAGGHDVRPVAQKGK